MGGQAGRFSNNLLCNTLKRIEGKSNEETTCEAVDRAYVYVYVHVHVCGRENVVTTDGRWGGVRAMAYVSKE